MGWGREQNNITRLSMEGSSEEKMSSEDGEQKAKTEEHVRDASKAVQKMGKRLKENYKEGRNTVKGQKK